MSMMWLKKQAKWIIIPFGVLIVVGLVWMDRAGASRSSRDHSYAGKVDGEEISAERFVMEMKNYVHSEEMRSGKAPEGVQLQQMREGLFNFKVQSILLDKQFANYALMASTDEMLDYLSKHPQDVSVAIRRYKGYEELPSFMADSSIDENRYRNWLSQDSVYDRASMREMEVQMKSTVIPQSQLQQIIKAQIHPTNLEEAFAVAGRENKARLKFYAVAFDSLKISADKYKDEELQAYFKAHADSFTYEEEGAQLGYIRLSLTPSKGDSVLMFDFAKELKGKALENKNFAELASSYSNDPASAEKGGNLGGFHTRETWTPAFSAAAFALNPGEISDPVLTPYGYHIIMLNAKKTDSAVEKADVSHILLKITAGAETLDSLQEKAKTLKELAEKKDDLAAIAKENNLTYEKTPIFDKTNPTPINGTYVQGIISFAFSPHESKEKISDALQNDEAIYLFEKVKHFAKGSSFERAKARIAESLLKQEKKEFAEKALNEVKSQIMASTSNFQPSVGKAILDSSGLISAESWLPSYGYASPALFKALNQAPNTWGPIALTEQSAAMALVVEKQVLSNEQIQSKAVVIPNSQNENFLVSSLYQEWVTSLQKSTKIENNLDMLFRE